LTLFPESLYHEDAGPVTCLWLRFVENLYGKKIDAKDIVLKGAVKAPPSASTLLSTLDKASPIL
jgi:hypothetical protein